MNRIYGWEPEPFYNISEVTEHPTMPSTLKWHIVKIHEKHCKKTIEGGLCPRLRMVWLECHGATGHDQEWLGPIAYMPMHGFPGYFYPFLNQQHYLSPVVWIQMNDITPGVIITVECKLWAKNIKHDPGDPMVGGVRFEIMMD